MHTQLILNESVSLGMQNPHLEHISSVLGPYTGGKNPGCKVTDSLNLSEFSFMGILA